MNTRTQKGAVDDGGPLATPNRTPSPDKRSARFIIVFMAERQGVHLLFHPPVISQHSDIIDSTIVQFITIRRIMVSNLVSNGWGASAAGGIGVIVYEPYPRLGFEGCQFRGIYPEWRV